MSSTTEIDTNTFYTSMPLTLSRNKLIQDVLLLFQCKPNKKSFAHFIENAHFEDPLCDAHNKREIQAQFYGMPKIFSNSMTKECQLKVNESNEIRLNLTQVYTLRYFEKSIEMNSEILIKLNEQGLITQLEDRWNHKDSWRDGGLLNLFKNNLRRINAMVLPVFVNFE